MSRLNKTTNGVKRCAKIMIKKYKCIKNCTKSSCKVRIKKTAWISSSSTPFVTQYSYKLTYFYKNWSQVHRCWAH